MSVLTVGTGMQFSTVNAAVAASHDGDTIFVKAGTYLNDFSIIKTKIEIVGVGGMAHFEATKAPTNGKAFLVTNTDVKLDHLEFSGAKVSDLNGAGVRFQGGGTLTITNSYFHDNQDGVLGGGIHPEGDIIIDHSEFARNGAGDGMSHNLYIAESHSLTVTNSYLHDAVVGHEVKSRAEITTVLNNRIVDGNSSSSYGVDLGAGGVATIRGNYIQQGANSQNPAIINYGSETRDPWAASSLTIEDNTIVNQLAKKAIGVNDRIGVTAHITGNHIYGLTSAQVATGPNAQSGNDTLASAPSADTSHPWSDSPWDNLVWGGAATNVLNGTTGRDLFAGGAGSDTFVIQAGGNSDTIAAFNSAGGHDVVRLEGTTFTSFAGVSAAMVQQGDDVVLNLGKGETLTFQDKLISSLGASDFTFGAIGSAPPPPANNPPPPSNNPPPPPASDPPPSGTHAALFKLAEGGNVTNNMVGTNTNNSLTGTAQNDRITGHGGSDTMQGGAGDDTYMVDNSGKDVVVEKAGAGVDTVVSTATSFTLANNVEHLTLNAPTAQTGIGNALDNIIAGSKTANDTLSGGDGNDILKVGAGANLVTGGSGHDIFVFSAAGARSTITDFHVGDDLIDLRQMMSSAHYTGSDPLADHTLAMTSDGHGGSILSANLTHTGGMHAIADLQGVAPDTLYVGLDVLWH